MDRQHNPTVPLAPCEKTRQVTLQKYTATGTDANGHETGAWGNLASYPTVWARVRQLGSATAEYAHQLFAEATHRVLIDYRADLTAGPTGSRLRVLDGSRVLYVGMVNDLGDCRVTLELLCAEGEL